MSHAQTLSFIRLAPSPDGNLVAGESPKHVDGILIQSLRIIEPLLRRIDLPDCQHLSGGHREERRVIDGPRSVKTRPYRLRVRGLPLAGSAPIKNENPVIEIHEPEIAFLRLRFEQMVQQSAVIAGLAHEQDGVEAILPIELAKKLRILWRLHKRPSPGAARIAIFRCQQVRAQLLDPWQGKPVEIQRARLDAGQRQLRRDHQRIGGVPPSFILPPEPESAPAQGRDNDDQDGNAA